MNPYFQRQSKPTSEYDSYFTDADAFIMKNRVCPEIDIEEYCREADEKISILRYGAGEPPALDRKELNLAIQPDFYRPWGGNDYMHCPEMYCAAIKRKLVFEAAEFSELYPDGVPEKPWYTVFPPLDFIPMHDAVFVEGDQPELLDPKPEPKRKKNWWDEDVIIDEFGMIPNPDYDTVNERVDWYLNNSEDLGPGEK